MCGTLPALSFLLLMIGPLGMQEMLIILVVALIVFGPRKLPQIGKTLGKSIAEFRRTSTELRSTLEREVQMEEFRAARSEVTDLKKDVTNLGRGLDPAGGTAPAGRSEAGNSPAPGDIEPGPAPVAPEPGDRADPPPASASETETETGAAEDPACESGAAGDGEAAESESRGDSGK
jgi:Tat protein translocase TatB subunit